MSPRRAICAVVAVVLWGLALLLPWQAALDAWPWLRAALALLLFSVPGFCLHALLDDQRELDLVVRAPAALCLSAGVTGLLGFVGSVLELPTPFVTNGLLLVGAGGLALLALRGGLRLPRLDPQAWDRERLISTVLLTLLVLVAARLCVAPVLGSDDLTHVARLTAFQQRARLGFAGVVFGGGNVVAPRYWLSLWPLAEAVLATLSGLHALPLTVNYLGPLLAVPAALAVYNLARGLALSRGLAVLAVAAQLAGLFLSATRDRPGLLFFNRLTEDKFVALFVLAPIFLQIVLAFLAQPTGRKLARLAVAWLALLFCHSTSLGMAFLVVGAFCGLELLLARRWQAALVLAVIVPLTASAGLVRFVPHPDQERVFFDVETAAQHNEVTEGRQRRIERIAGTRFYGIGAASVGSLGKVIGGIVLLLALLRARRERVARYVLAALGTVALAVIPYTGWLLGMLLTPFHLWRILCLLPFGIATAFVAHVVLERAVAVGDARSIAPARAVRAGLVACAALVVLVAALNWQTLAGRSRLAALDLAPDWDRSLRMRMRGTRERWKVPYTDLAALARALDSAIPERAVVVADGGLNDVLPSLSVKVVLLAFRSPAQTTQHASIPLPEARQRWTAQSRVVNGDATPAEAAQYLRSNQVELVVTADHKDWLQRIPPELLPRKLVGRFGALEVYRLGMPDA